MSSDRSSLIRWLVIPGVSLGVLVLSAALSYWLTRPVQDTPPTAGPAPAAEPPSQPPPAVRQLPTPGLTPPDATPPPVLPPPSFPTPQSVVPAPPAPAGDPRRVVEVEPVIESTSGRIHTDDIRAAIRAVTPLVQQCFEDAAQRNRGPQTVKLRFTVEAGREGGVMSAGELVSSTIPDPFVQACALDSLLDVRFPAPFGGGKATVVYPFEFRVPGETGR
ncbi:AgmX/PglI C-terminal domain-containing protein [Myxococcus sp. Y35]|uniref:AgmX/PglI C-terminal domain-containing protein n=1 Tax=Pseudomyxococcus flavus TaxID=3115648 RepID=UPI003CED3997